MKIIKRCDVLGPIAAASLALAWATGESNPDGRAVLMKMAESLAKSPNWCVTVHSSYDAVQSDGYKVEWNDVRKVALSRPDRLRIESERSDGAHSLVIFNGKDVTTFDESANVFAQTPLPGNLDEAVIYFVRDLKMRLRLAVMLLTSMPQELQQRVQFVKYVEKTTTLGAPADHIAAKTATVDFQLWVTEGDRPLPLRVVLTYKNERGQPQFRAQFSDWDLDSKPADSLFAFTPPADARKIPFAASLQGIAPAPQGLPSRGSASRTKGGRQ
jgi:hypothetical protein